ncbi:MAG: hypothetical protein J2P36_17510 [Ktedonobacteraceae bacterium]|nr:hypothetical protein [Ktedonobacteraceae bacterium]
MSEAFQPGVIVRHRQNPSQWLRLQAVTSSEYGLVGSFEPIKRDGTRDYRFAVGYTGNLDAAQYECVPLDDLMKKSTGELRKELRRHQTTS